MGNKATNCFTLCKPTVSANALHESHKNSNSEEVKFMTGYQEEHRQDLLVSGYIRQLQLNGIINTKYIPNELIKLCLTFVLEVSKS